MTTWPQVWLHLIDQLPAILAAVAAVVAALYGAKNRQSIKAVVDQGNGRHQELVTKLDDALTENRALRGEVPMDSTGQTPRSGGG